MERRGQSVQLRKCKHLELKRTFLTGYRMKSQCPNSMIILQNIKTSHLKQFIEAKFLPYINVVDAESMANGLLFDDTKPKPLPEPMSSHFCKYIFATFRFVLQKYVHHVSYDQRQRQQTMAEGGSSHTRLMDELCNSFPTHYRTCLSVVFWLQRACAINLRVHVIYLPMMHHHIAR